MQLRLIILFLLLMTGCVGDYVYVKPEYSSQPKVIITIELDSALVTKDRAAIRSAIAKWNYALNRNIILLEGGTRLHYELLDRAQELDTWYIERRHSDNVDWKAIGDKDAIAYANSVGGYRISLIRDLLSDSDIEPVVMHEIGHLLGSDHNVAYLMYRILSPGTYKCVDVLTMLRVAKANDIPIEKLRYCVYP